MTSTSIKKYTRLDPYSAKVLECRTLSKKGSSKEILHIVCDLSNSDITYTVGSSFGLLPENLPQFVDEVIESLGSPYRQFLIQTKNGESLSFEEFLTKHANLSQITSRHFALVGKEPVPGTTYNLATFLTAFWHPEIPLQALVDITAPMLPRYYSIASSMKKVGAEVHFMVASFHYLEANRMKESITASYLKSSPKTIRLFLQENINFTLPDDPNTPIIMIGPGTGLAAFRGFIQERTENKSWLFTGDRNESTDFHYKEELLAAQNLTLTTAFSRDSSQKIYVQHRLLEHSQKLWSWIQNGAHIYICGDAKSMAKDVQLTLHQIAETEGNLTTEEAKAFFKTLRKEKRLLLDIY